MLRGIHKASSSWLGKGIMAIVMGLLVVSFAIWGIGDIFRGVGRSTVATVGDSEITIEQFRAYYNDRLSQMSRRVGRPITPDQARAFGLDRQMLSQLVGETALDQKARDLKLGVADAEISGRITTDPNFQGVNGQFDPNRFQILIRQAGYTESRFVQEQRQVVLRRQIAFSITGDLKPPATLLSALERFTNEKRSADLITLTPAQAGEILKPDDAALQKYFEERKASFRTPELRNVTVLAVTPAELARAISVSDDDAKASYEERKSEYGTPEKRELQQILFPTLEEAQAASERIAKGLSFDDLVKERGLKSSDIDLGLVAKASVIDPAVADAAFSLPADRVSAPVKGRFGYVLVRVSKIQAATQSGYPEVASQIKTNIAETRARSQIADLRDKIEDERASGATLAETAKKLNLGARTISALDRSGRDADGVPVPNLPSREVIDAAFATDVGVDNEALQLPGGGYVWYDLTGITPSRERTLDEVKPQVEKRWQDDEVTARLKAKGDEFLAKLKSGVTLAQIAKDNGLSVTQAKDLLRGKPSGFVPPVAIDAIFRTPKGDAGTAEGPDSNGRIIFVVTDVVEPPFDPAASDVKKNADALRTSFGDDLLGQYLARVQSDLGVKINPTALQQVVGGGTAN